MTIKEKIKSILEKGTVPDGKQALIILAEEIDKLNNEIIELKKRIKRK